ncbi:MAG: AzlC family ABC transporter permease [Actinobacteria bacterium]|nr:AzlC family ABC transporter permease [Actinomycetota bacterium]
MSGSPSFRRGLRDGLPILFAVGSLGVVFGVLAVEAGFAWWIALLASVIVVSGAAQFALVGLAGSGVLPILVATTGLALRHVPMSARLSSMIRGRSRPVRLAMAWVLVDETFGLTIAASDRGETDIVAYKSGADLMLYGGWVGGTVIGVAVGDRIDPASWGAEVFFALLFVALAAPLLRRWADAVTAVLAVVAVFVAAEFLPDAWQITTAAAAAALVGTVLPDG